MINKYRGNVFLAGCFPFAGFERTIIVNYRARAAFDAVRMIVAILRPHEYQNPARLQGFAETSQGGCEFFVRGNPREGVVEDSVKPQIRLLGQVVLTGGEVFDLEPLGIRQFPCLGYGEAAGVAAIHAHPQFLHHNRLEAKPA